jgi:hypothetical protein
MQSAELGIHLVRKEVPKVTVQIYTSFFTVDIVVPGGLNVNLFTDSPQDLVNFKNNLLWAFENPIDYRK